MLQNPIEFNMLVPIVVAGQCFIALLVHDWGGTGSEFKKHET